MSTAPDTLQADKLSFRENVIHHDLKVAMFPKENRFVAEDTVTVPERFSGKFRFFLHKGLDPSSPTKDIYIVKETEQDPDVLFESYRIKLPQGSNIFVLRYGGIINHPVLQYGKEQARGYSQTAGTISDEGVYLAGNSYWYPRFDKLFETFNLQIELPAGWNAISQGERILYRKEQNATKVRWESPEPQDEIFIIAGKFNEYEKKEGEIQALVFLRSPDKGLADKYLDATIRYITMYDKLIGPYPYKKFALVENFWETGFGMPSFTLLGPKVIRFPFIITSSYPHEILHNWWGNSVFPDYEKGNWSEGLTAYLSDHLLKEQQGEGVEYRQTTLQKYTDYVLSDRDFPLAEFRSRHSSSSEAIGYGKSLMFFHMLRLELGDSAFIDGLRHFYRKSKFQFAAFTDLRESFEQVSGKTLLTEFDQWVAKTGAPKLRINKVDILEKNDQYVLTAVIEQVQQGDAFRLHIPVAITIEGHDHAVQKVLKMDGKYMKTQLTMPERPLRLDIDPEFDLFRRLDREEVPPAISQALGCKKMLAIMPSSASAALIQAYQEFARVLSNSGPDEVKAVFDNEIKQLPADYAVTVFGRENRFLNHVVSALSLYSVTLNEKGISIGKTEIPFKGHSLVLATRNPENRDMAMLFIDSDLPEALQGLSRKVPHYHKYSYLGFKGNEPVNIVKGRWPVLDSPMTVFIPGKNGDVSRVGMGKLHRRKPLATLQTGFSADHMMETIHYLSSDERKGRGLGTPELDQAGQFIAERFREANLKPVGDEENSYYQVWEEKDSDKTGHTIVLKNIIGVIPGSKSELSGQSIVIGAHYDHLGLSQKSEKEKNRGQIFHGADDNASGIAVLTELARSLGKSLKPERSVVFVAFTGEEKGRKGSQYYIAHQKQYPAHKCIGMVNLDTVGRLGDHKLLVLGSGSAKEWTNIFRGAGYVSGVEVEMVSQELDSSDQKTFHEAGVPAVQLFSGPHADYHKPTDTADKIDSEGLIKAARVVREVIEYLAKKEKPLTPAIHSGEKVETVSNQERKVSLGIIPDFAFPGDGCRISGVLQGSPAAEAGLKEGDIIMRINSTAVHTLKDLSDILKSLHPGDKIVLTFLREGKEKSIEAEVREK